MSQGVPVVQHQLNVRAPQMPDPSEVSSGKESRHLKRHSSTFKGSFSVINKQAGAGQAGAALPLRAATRLHTSPVSCRLGELELALQSLLPAGHSLRNVTGNTHAIYRPTNYSHRVYV